MQLVIFDGAADDPHTDEAIAAEVTVFDKEYVEVKFQDRNEQMYLRFQLRDLVAAAQALHGDE